MTQLRFKGLTLLAEGLVTRGLIFNSSSCTWVGIQ